MMMPEAIIITIGNELLIGQVIDTNAAWIAQALNEQGVSVRRHYTVADRADEIEAALDASKAVRFVIITGGLGPTGDDITKNVLCGYFGGKLILDRRVAAHLDKIFSDDKIRRLPGNEGQAWVPDNCEVLYNRIGTAPGMCFQREGQEVYSLPGVPAEMKAIFSEALTHRLSAAAGTGTIMHRTLLVMGIGESVVAAQIEDIEQNMPSFLQLAYLPGTGFLRLRITGSHEQKQTLAAAIEQTVTALKTRLGVWIAATEDASIEHVLADLLRTQKKTLALAESCTGGYLAHLLTNIPGSSEFFSGGYVAYSNDLKQAALQVPTACLQRYGAVSAEAVAAMAEGARKNTGADVALSVSGILGPDGGTPEKPVGTVWMAIADAAGTTCRRFHFRHDRLQNKERAAQTAFDWLRRHLAGLAD